MKLKSVTEVLCNIYNLRIEINGPKFAEFSLLVKVWCFSWSRNSLLCTREVYLNVRTKDYALKYCVHFGVNSFTLLKLYTFFFTPFSLAVLFHRSFSRDVITFQNLKPWRKSPTTYCCRANQKILFRNDLNWNVQRFEAEVGQNLSNIGTSITTLSVPHCFLFFQHENKCDNITFSCNWQLRQWKRALWSGVCVLS